IRVSKQYETNYRLAIAFMKDAKTRGELVLAVPEDAGLYFASGVECPTRAFVFTPGVIAPGKMMNELIGEIERKKVRYLVWSNRTFPEYGVSIFGTSFAPELGQYFRAHYRPTGRLMQTPPNMFDLSLTVWERKSDNEIVESTQSQKIEVK